MHGFVALLRHAKHNALRAHLTLTTHNSLDVMVGVVGRDVVGGTVGGTAGGTVGGDMGGATHGVVVPFSSIAWIDLAAEGVSSLVDALGAAGSDEPRVQVSDLFDNSRRLSHTVTCHTLRGDISGVIVALAPGVVVLHSPSGHTRALASAAILWFSVDL